MGVTFVAAAASAPNSPSRSRTSNLPYATMIDRIINGALQNRLLVLVLIAGIAGAGYWAYTEVPTDSYPDVSPTLVQVFTVSPGLSPVDVETQISYPVEISMYGLPQLERVQSTSIFGLSRVNVYFEDGTDIYFARRLVLERLGKARGEIPPASAIPSLGRLRPASAIS